MNRLKKRFYHWRADVHLLSYPKCGRTWLRLMLSDVLRGHCGARMKNPHQIHKAGSLLRGVPCILMAHDWRGISGAVETMQLERDKRRFHGRSVLLLVRDPRDVVVSNYFQKRYREHTFDGSIHEFVHDPVRGIESIVEYYNIWAQERRQTRSFALVRYEDMRRDTAGELLRVLEYCGIHGVSTELIDTVVERYEFSNMKRMERQGVFESRSVMPGEAGNPDSFKTRSGKVGGYREHLDAGDRQYVDDLIVSGLDPLFEQYRSA